MKQLVAARWVAVSMLGILLVAACGTSTTSSNGSLSGTIVMSMIGPLTGQYGPYGIPLLEGAETAAKVINDNGGINGAKLQMDQVDTVGDPGDAVTALNKELAIGNPVALIGPLSIEIKAVQPIFDGRHIVDGLNAGSPAFDTNTDPYLWRCNASDSQLTVAEAALANEKGYKKAVAMVTSAGGLLSQIPTIKKAFEALGGTLVDSIPLLNGQTSYRSEVQKAINDKPDVIFLSVDPASASVIFSNFQELDNLAIPFIGTDSTALPEFVKAVGPNVAKAHMTSVQGSSALTSAGDQFKAAYQQLNGHAPYGGAAYAYDCAMTFALAIAKANNSNAAVWVNSIPAVANPPGVLVSDFKTALADIKAGTKINYDGVSGPMDFDQYHNVAGAWDVEQATGKADGSVSTIETISAATIQGVISKEGP